MGHRAPSARLRQQSGRYIRRYLFLPLFKLLRILFFLAAAFAPIPPPPPPPPPQAIVEHTNAAPAPRERR